MNGFKNSWTLESALTVVRHPTVDGTVWAEAVEWLLIYGPPDIRAMLEQAAGQSMTASFPGLRPKGYAPDGSPCYDIAELAALIGISEEEARERIAVQEERHGIRQSYGKEDSTVLQ